jgi:hypothetical protein
MKKINFSYNWNNKLECKSFSTVRLENPEKYQLLELFEVVLKTKKNEPEIKKGIARLQVVNSFYLDKVTPGMSFLDANLPVIDFIKLVQTMYKNKGIDFKKKKLSFLVFQYLSEKEMKQLQLE